MRKQFRPLALLTCITAAAAFGGQIAAADTGAPASQTQVKGGQHQHRGDRAERHRGHRGERHFKRMAQELGLTDQQKSQAKTLFEGSRAENKPMFQALMTAKRQLRTLVQSGSADEAAIRAQAAKVAGAEADLAVKRAQGTKQFLALLTPDQVTKYQAMQAKREAKPMRFGGCDKAPMQ